MTFLISFSPAVESFGLRPVLNSASKSTPSKSHRGLMDMPTEILFEIIHLLDSFRYNIAPFPVNSILVVFVRYTQSDT